VKDTEFAKLLVLINGAVPITFLVLDVATGQAGANPRDYVIHTTGILTIIFLLLSLCVTPLRKITGINYWSNFRRTLGVYSFFYLCVHVLAVLNFDFQFDIVKAAKKIVAIQPGPELIRSLFLAYGATAFVLLIPLALTSTNGMIKRLGAKRWKRLHQLVYIASILGVLHYLNFGKYTTGQSKIFAAVLVFLLGFRIVVAVMPKKPAPRPVVAAKPRAEVH
jgi:sulfoxide reductase heme-binding subunit YedZ